MMMENFLTWEVLLTFTGCVAGTVLLTEWLKKIFANLPTQFVSFVIATVILIVGHAATGTFVWAEALLYLVNAVAVSLSANGGFDILQRAFGKKDTDAGTLVVETTEEGNALTYLELSKNPEDYTDGEKIHFVVRTQKEQGV